VGQRSIIPSLTLLPMLLAMQPRPWLAFWAASCTSLGHTELLIPQHPHVLLLRTALHPCIPQPVRITRVALTKMQDPALGPVELDEVQTGPLLQLVQVLLDGIK